MTEKKKPEIDPRFVYQVTRRNRRTNKTETAPALNADGHIDYAHQIGLDCVTTEIVDNVTTEDRDGGSTRWITMKATVSINGKLFTGFACANSRKVMEPGNEVALAETRAIKRAIAVACNITEKVINPSGKIPTREIVDMPLDEHDEEEHDIPSEIKRGAGEIINADEQFRV
jgi:hypothetical protein